MGGKQCLWHKFITKILVRILVARNVIWWQSLAGPHDAYGLYKCHFTISSFNFSLPTYFVSHYIYGRALYAVFYRRVFLKKVEHICLTVVWQMTCQRQHKCWCASCWHHVFVLLAQFALVHLKIYFWLTGDWCHFPSWRLLYTSICTLSLPTLFITWHSVTTWFKYRFSCMTILCAVFTAIV